jgi:hypothetical protein
MEAIGFECLICFLSSTDEISRHFTLYGDNKGVVEGWWNRRSRNRAINNIFKCIRSSTAESGHSFHMTYVASKHNPADGPSRGIYPSSAFLLPPVALHPSLNRFLVDAWAPYTPTEHRKVNILTPSPSASMMVTSALRRAYDSVSVASMWNSLNTSSNGMTNHSKFDTTLPTQYASNAKPRPYRSDLTPMVSTLRPHCPAHDR